MIGGFDENSSLNDSLDWDSDDDQKEKDYEKDFIKKMDTYDPSHLNRTEFFSTSNPDLIEKSLVAYLRKLKIEPLIHKTKYKLKFVRQGTNEFSHKIQDDVEVCVRILRIPDDKTKCCIQFTKLSGNMITFVKHFNEYRTDENCLSFADNCENHNFSKENENKQKEQKLSILQC